MNQGGACLPGFWRFTWLFFMQPITLHRLLRSIEVDPKESVWKLLRRPRSPYENWWLLRSAQMLLLILPGTAIIAAGLSLAYGLQVRGFNLVATAFCFIAYGVALGAVIHLVDGLAFGFAIGIAFVVFSGVSSDKTHVVAAMALGVGGGAAAAIAFGISSGVAADPGRGLALGAFAGVISGIYGGLPGAGLGGGACGAAFFRVPVFVLEAVAQTAARFWSAAGGRKTLHWAPVLYHELSYLPHPFLQSHLLAEADSDPILARRVLDACSVSPGQRRTGRKAEAKLCARELKRLAEAEDFQAIQELRGVWLPGVQGADGLLLSFSEAGRYLAAANAAFNPHHRLKHLQGFEDQLNAIGNQLRSNRDAFTQPFEEPLRALREVGQQLRVEAEKNAAGLIPNPFRAGNPLSGEEGPELFRGRETAIRDIEETLADVSRTASLQLLAPRRSGKTSLLKMLPRMLPDTVCVFFDVQAHPVASVGAFWSKLAEQAQIHAKLDRRADLPPLPDGPPMEAAAAWLEKLDQLPGGRRVLIAIDEFERLEDLFPGSRREFLQLMGLFRATIQHRRRVRLLVSGAAPFDELDQVWDDHFISARQIKLPFLDMPTSIGLLTAPSPDFPPGTIPAEVAQAVYRQTGGQPFLLQVFGSLLVSQLNEEKRKVAAIDDVKAVEGRAIEWAEAYLREMHKSMPAAAREALGHLTQGQQVELTPLVRRWLAQRYLLTPDDRLAIPLFGAWIEHHALV